MADAVRVRTEWHGDELVRTTSRQVSRSLDEAVADLVALTKSRLSRRFPPASDPGEYPAMRSGTLEGSIDHEPFDGGLGQRIGTGELRGKFLELGTSRMAARPFLRPLLQEQQLVMSHFGDR